MSYECPEYDWIRFDQYDNLQCSKMRSLHHDPRRRRSTTSSKYIQRIPKRTSSYQQHYPRSQYIDDENDLCEPPLCNGELDNGTMTGDHRLDDYYMNSAPIPPWSRSLQRFQQRPRMVIRPDYLYDDEGDIYSYDEDDLATRGRSFHNKINGVGQYFDLMTSLPLPHQYIHQNNNSQQLYNRPNRPTRKLYRESTRNYPARYSLNLDFADDDENEDVLDCNNYNQTKQHISNKGKNIQKRHHPLEHAHHRQRHPLPFYGPAPSHRPPTMLPMPQPMIHPSSLLPYVHHPHPQPQPQFGYGVPTVRLPGSTNTPGSSMPFRPMMMMVPTELPSSHPDTQGNNEPPQQMDIKTGIKPETTAVPTSPPSDGAKSSHDPPNINNASSSPVTSSLLSSASAPTSTKHKTNGENSLIPLVRSLSLGESRSLGTKPRRRSLLENLFGLDGFRLSRNNSISSNINRNSTNESSSSQITTNSNSVSSAPSSSSSSSSLSSMVPVNKLTRKQSLSLEKNVKVLSQRSYIWCYQIKPLSGQQQQQHETGCWVAMTPKNQTKLDPYICYYRPSAMVKGTRTNNLSTLVTLEKEPKLSGSFTAMPQAKIARVYPSMFSSANYIEVLIDCLPGDSQFVVRSD